MDIENTVKGKIAQAIVDWMFRKAGYKVYYYGYESVLQNLAQLGANFDRTDPVGKMIQTTPDFIIIDKQGRTSYLEVKYRAFSFLEQDIPNLVYIKDRWLTDIMLVKSETEPNFKLVDNIKLPKNISFISVQQKYNAITDSTLKECENLVKKYLNYPQSM